MTHGLMRLPLGLPLAGPTAALDRAPSEMAQPGRSSRPADRAVRRSGTPARSAFFGCSIRVSHLNDPRLAFALDFARLTPGPAGLPGEASFVQDRQDGVGAHLRQPVRRLPQGPLQGGQRPGGGAVPLAVRRATHFFQNPLTLGAAIDRRRTAAVPGGPALPAPPG